MSATKVYAKTWPIIRGEGPHSDKERDPYDNALIPCQGCGGEHLHQDQVDQNLEGLNIHFWCEECEALTILSIKHHEGITLIDAFEAVATFVRKEPVTL